MPGFINKKYRVFTSANSLSLGLGLLILLSVPRFMLVLQANRSGHYHWVSIIFLIMICLPWVILNDSERRLIGIRKIRNKYWLIMSLFVGLLGAAMIYYLMLVAFGEDTLHPYGYIARSYQLPQGALVSERMTYFLIYSTISMTLSPLGEELFYRGLVHEYFAVHLGHARASYLDSTAFALVHLAHFGIVFEEGTWHWLPWPSVAWVLGLFLICRLFFWSRQKSGAIWGAVVAHAAFNLGMNYFIFFHLL